jgi:hypothetical protein
MIRAEMFWKVSAVTGNVRCNNTRLVTRKTSSQLLGLLSADIMGKNIFATIYE